MEMIPLRSTDIYGVGYEDGTMYISFNPEEIYAYQGVPLSVYNGFRVAASQAKYFLAHIKGRYSDMRIG